MQPSMTEMRAMVEAAVRAPSSHNTQPWFFEIAHGHVDVWVNRTRALPALIADAPLVVVITTDADDANSWLGTGRALQHLPLVAAADGVHAGYLNQPCQVTAIRRRLHEALDGSGFPQLIVRLGRHDHQRHRSPQRTIDEVLNS